MIVMTFVAGLIPVIGNLISNVVVVIVSLSMSPFVAIGSLIYLVAIHKLEYFLNARLVGTQIEARAWELLLAMLLMEAAFGIAGLIAAPIYYAYLKDELTPSAGRPATADPHAFPARPGDHCRPRRAPAAAVGQRRRDQAAAVDRQRRDRLDLAVGLHLARLVTEVATKNDLNAARNMAALPPF